MGSDVLTIRGTSEKVLQAFVQYSGSGCIFLIERCALSAMNRESQTLDETM